MPEPSLVLRQEAGVAHLVLNAPPRNEMDSAFFGELARLRADVFPGLRVRGMVVHGAGRHFSSGAKVEELEAMLQETDAASDAPFLVENVKNFLALESLPFPVVAAIGGCCFGAGMELALACHYRIAAPRATFALPEAGFGLMPGCGGTVRLTRLVGRGKAVEMVLGGQTMLADEALCVGLVDAVVDRKELLKAAGRFVRRQAA
jgi:enoyl-CoA hydratase/carnithine racemase